MFFKLEKPANYILFTLYCIYSVSRNKIYVQCWTGFSIPLQSFGWTGEQASVSLVFWVGRFSLKYQNLYVFKLLWEWRSFSSYMCLSKQRISKVIVVNMISGYTASYRDSCLSQSSCYYPIYMDVIFGAIAAIVYKKNYLWVDVICVISVKKLLILMNQIFRWIKLTFVSEKIVQARWQNLIFHPANPHPAESLKWIQRECC